MGARPHSASSHPHPGRQRTPPRRFVLVRGCRPSLLAVPAVAASRPPIFSTFDAGNEGWVVVSYPFRGHVAAPLSSALPFDAANGLPPGSVRVGDIFGETGIAAPAAYLGDMRSFYGGRLAYDILIRFSDNTTYPGVVLNGGTGSVYCDAPSPAIGSWEARTVPLTEAGWKVSGTTVAATQAQFLAVLQNLVGLYIYTEWHTGEDDTNVDNVVMTPGSTGVGDDPATVTLALAASPNPAAGPTVIAFTPPAAGRATVDIFDLRGRLVRRLTGEAAAPRVRQTFAWDGSDADGSPVPSGVYFYRVALGAIRATGRLAIAR
jgi:hypothetical protein